MGTYPRYPIRGENIAKALPPWVMFKDMGGIELREPSINFFRWPIFPHV